MIDCTLVTCERVPALDPDDRLLLQKLCERGLKVSTKVWSDPSVDWEATGLCILRSTWDYHTRYHDFIGWIEQVAALTTIRNNPRLLHWNAHKSYLRELELLGVPVVPTVWVAQGRGRSLADLCEARSWRDVVLKPARGAAAHDVKLVRRESASLALGQAHLNQIVQTQDMLVQPYLKTVVTYGERALMFFHGRYSHAVVKKPFDTVLAISDARSSRVEATPEEIEVGTKAIESVPGQPLYARVDLLRDHQQKVRVSEVELIEPALYLAVHDAAPATFADAVERELATVRQDARVPTRPAGR